MNYLTRNIVIPKPGKTGKATIGIPKAMMFYEHGRLWENFFRRLGCEVVTSDDTNRKILNDGVSRCTNENCLPIKVLTGHVMELAGKADFIFIPRYKSTDKMEFTCPKFCGLPDMVRMNLGGKTEILEVDIDFNSCTAKMDESLRKISSALDIDYGRACDSFNNTVINRFRPEMEAGSEIAPELMERPAISILGHPYVINDNFISMNLKEKLLDRNYNVLTPVNLDRSTKRQNTYPQQGFFYGVGYDILGSTFTYVQDPNVKGLIYISTFSCGVDSILTEYIERHLKKFPSVPYMKITVDEHTGEAGFDTRLEAFLDMIEVRDQKTTAIN